MVINKEKNIREHKGNSLLELPSDYVLVDIETTGLSPKSDDIIEIGAIKVKDNEIVDKYESLIKIDYKISSYISSLTGITNKMLESGKDVEVALHEFFEFAKDDVLVAHNANFDINFLYDKGNMHIDRHLKNDFVDTMRLAKKILPGLPNYKLGTLASHFEIDYSAAHRGLADVKITHEVYNGLKCCTNEI